MAFAGAAAAARAVFEHPVEGAGDSGDASFAALHGLHWLTVNLSAESPVLLEVDDLQWADRPSLRFFAYLLRRLEGLQVLMAATLRTTDPGTDPDLLGEIATDPSTVAIRPGLLSEAAVLELVRERLGADADEGFSGACHVATGGNPLLLRQLLSSLAADHVQPARPTPRWWATSAPERCRAPCSSGSRGSRRRHRRGQVGGGAWTERRHRNRGRSG